MKQVKGYPSIVDMFALLGVLALFSFITSVIAYLFVDKSVSDSVVDGRIIAIVFPVSFVLTIIFALIFRMVRLRGIEDKGSYSLTKYLRPSSSHYVLWGFILLLATNVVMDPVVSLFPDSLARLQRLFDIPFVPLVLCSVIFAPVLEEVLFRVIMIGDLRQQYNPVVAILVSSLIFAVAHFNLAQGISAFFSGIVLGYIFVVSSSMWSVIFIHMLNNLTVVVFNSYMSKDNGYMSMRDLITADWIYYTIFISSLVLMLIAIVRIFTLKDSKNEKLDVADDIPESINVENRIL